MTSPKSIAMRGMFAALAAAAALGVAGGLAAPASAAPPPPGCERIPILGLNPQVREICDLPIHADGSWERWRWFWAPDFVSSQCDPAYQVTLTSGQPYCPTWAPRMTTPAQQGPTEKYIVTADTVPPGEPGYIGS